MEEKLSICELIKKRLDLNEDIIVSLDEEFSKYSKEEQERHFKITYPDGYVTGAYSDNKFYYQKSRDCEKERLEFLHKRYLENCAKYRNYKEFKYFADAGSLAVGFEDFIVNLSNRYGDGSFSFRVYEENIDLHNLKGWVFDRTIKGDDFYIFDYDCLDKKERYEAIERGKAIKLSGRYAVYTRDARCNFAFVKCEQLPVWD